MMMCSDHRGCLALVDECVDRDYGDYYALRCFERDVDMNIISV